MRLFTGIGLSDSVIDNLARLIDRLRPTAHVNWCPAYNFHITTKFIGEWPEERSQQLVDALRPLGSRPSFPVSITGIGWFPNPHSPRVLWAGIKDTGEIQRLATDTDAALQPLGIQAEKKNFSAHLTLARIRGPGVPLAPLRQAIAQLASVEFGNFTASEFCLYLSKLGPSGSIYTQLARIPFISE